MLEGASPTGKKQNPACAGFCFYASPRPDKVGAPLSILWRGEALRSRAGVRQYLHLLFSVRFESMRCLLLLFVFLISCKAQAQQDTTSIRKQENSNLQELLLNRKRVIIPCNEKETFLANRKNEPPVTNPLLSQVFYEFDCNDTIKQAAQK